METTSIFHSLKLTTNHVWLRQVNLVNKPPIFTSLEGNCWNHGGHCILHDLLNMTTHLFTLWVKANLPFLGSSLEPSFPIRNAPTGSELGAWTGTKPCWLKTTLPCSVLPWNNRDHERRVLSLLSCQLTTKMTLTVLGNFCLILVVCSCPIKIVTGSLYDCWQRGGWGLCGKRLWETHIAVMTMVWQRSAAKECMDGMLLLIKDIFYSPSLAISQILCCLYQSPVI